MNRLINEDHWNSIHQILLHKWDPIGVKEFHNAADDDDEYDHYIPEIYSYLLSDNPYKNTFEFLWYLENEHIGLPGDINHTRKITSLLVDCIKT